MMPLNLYCASSLTRRDQPLKLIETTQQVLLDVFPQHVVDALKKGEKVPPERKDCVTIFFSDIVGFTTMSETMDSSEVRCSVTSATESN